MENIAEEVYDSLLGQTLEEYRLPWVEDAFGPGSLCLGEYERMDQARRRLCARLGTEDDADLEEILMSMEQIQRELCLKMFHYGMKWEKKGKL